MMTDLLIRRDEKIPRGTKLAYRVVMDYPITLDADGWLDEGEDGITLDELEKRIHEGSGWRTYRSLLTCIVDSGVNGDPIGDEEWVPVDMDGARPHWRPVAFETTYEAETRDRPWAVANREYVTLDQPCCPVCGSFKADSCDACEDGIPVKTVTS